MHEEHIRPRPIQRHGPILPGGTDEARFRFSFDLFFFILLIENDGQRESVFSKKLKFIHQAFALCHSPKRCVVDFSEQEKDKNDVFDEHDGDFIRSLLEDDESQNKE